MSKTRLSQYNLPMGKKGIGILLIILAMATAVSAAVLANAPTYTIVDGQNQIELNGRFDTVEAVLDQTNITLRPEDVVHPSLESPPPDNSKIEVIRAKTVTVRQGSQLNAYLTQQTNLQAFLDEVGIVTQPGDEIQADGEFITIVQLRNQPLPQLVEVGRAQAITIINGQEQQIIFSTANTVADVLLEASIPVDGSMIVSPPLTTPISPDMVISVERGIPVTILVDGRTETFRTSQLTPRDILGEANITLSPLDYTQPPLETPINEGAVIQVIRVNEEVRFEDSDIPYQTVWQATSDLNLDSQAILSQGQVGLYRREYTVRYENGVEVSNTLTFEGTITEPINEVYGYGTNIVVGTIQTNEGPREYWRIVRMRVTSYTAASSGKAPDHPAYGITASGLPAGYGIVAIDRNVVPFRSEVYVPGYGVAFAGDTGGGVRGRWIDLGYEEETFVPWSGYVDVYYLTPIPSPDNINYILPSQLP